MKPLCVLIAEDNDSLRRTLAEYLSTFGILSVQATTKAQIWNALQASIVDVIILDLIFDNSLMLPFVARIKQNFRTPVIITTAWDIEELAMGDYRDRLHDCFILKKPYDLGELRHTIIKLLGRGLPQRISPAC